MARRQFHRQKSRRGLCPNCGKKGVTNEVPVTTIYGACWVRTCQYCQHVGRRWLKDGKLTEVQWD